VTSLFAASRLLSTFTAKHPHFTHSATESSRCDAQQHTSQLTAVT